MRRDPALFFVRDRLGLWKRADKGDDRRDDAVLSMLNCLDRFVASVAVGRSGKRSVAVCLFRSYLRSECEEEPLSRLS